MIAFIIAQIAKIKAAVLGLKSTILTGSVSSTSPRTFTLANSTRAILMTTGPGSDRCSIYFISTTSGGSTDITSERTATSITVSSSENNKITLTSTAVISYVVIVCNGSVS